jgi:tetratricopeptide (TPR) repeat protein
VTEEILGDLERGGAVTLLGQPGAGKTTTCRMVAARWYEQDSTGPILYRQSGADPITGADVLIEEIQACTGEGPVLVFVEDAARLETVPLYKVLHELETDRSVSFLLNSREREWEQFDDLAVHHGTFNMADENDREILETRTRYIIQRQMPPLDEREIDRLIQRFEAVTGRNVTASAKGLLNQTAAEEGVNQMLLISYHFPIGEINTPTAGSYDSALERNVAEVHDRITIPDVNDALAEQAGDTEILQDVALLITILNAAGLPLYPEFTYAVGEDEADFKAIDGCREALDGVLLYGRAATGQYWSHHSIWAELYLKLHLETSDSENAARSHFERVLNDLFELLDSGDLRDAIREYLGRDTQVLREYDDHPTELADKIVSDVFEIGENRPALATLFGSTEYSDIQPPEICSLNGQRRSSLARARMYRMQGELDLARNELDRMHEIAPDSDDQIYYGEIGKLDFLQGNYIEARKHHQRSLEIRQEIGDQRGQAASFDNLGLVALSLGDYEKAQEYHERSLDIRREIGDRRGQATCLGNLGNVVQRLGEHEEAREYYEQSLEIQREIGDRHGQAASIDNLGLVARNLGDHEMARVYHQQSLEIRQGIGDRRGQSNSLGNLGLVAQKADNYEEAQEYHHQSLEIDREIGDRQGSSYQPQQSWPSCSKPRQP